MSDKSTVQFHEADLDKCEKVTLLDGKVIKFDDDRRVEVWRVKEEEGYCIRIFRPTNDGKVSKLEFGLKPNAAYALFFALSAHLNKE